MTLLRNTLFCLLLATAASVQAQTTLVARPSSDALGQAVFVVTEVLRVDGEWIVPPHPGQTLYPQRALRAYPLSRFGEAVLVTLPVPGNYQTWQGVHVHGGLIPALGGATMTEIVEDISQAVEAEKARHEHAPVNPVIKSPKQKLCPICKTVHATNLSY